ncbi:MAG: hypothetical protein AAFP98_06200 [Pseudomonadota bacterium]
MKRWVQHPPSKRRVQLVVGVICVCFALYGLEQFGLLPEWMQADRAMGRSLR